MKNRLFIVEGLPCSGKSTTSAFVASYLKKQGNVCFVDEGSGNHPADYEFHALAPAGLLSDKEEIVALSNFSGEMFDKLIPYKIYDFLPWEKEMPHMLEKWRDFVNTCKEDTIYVFNCVLLQNPMCETMMRFGFTEDKSRDYISKIAEIIQPMNPVVIYLKNTDISTSVRETAKVRPGWLDAVIDYHVNGNYGKEIGAEGFEGYIRCLEERQEREIRILEGLPVKSIIFDNPQRDWELAQDKIRAYLETPLPYTAEIDEYLECDDVIDYKNEAVKQLADALFQKAGSELEFIKAAYEYVRDHISHSADIGADALVGTASEVLKAGHGICFAKSHLLAALLRCKSVPVGFCYQKLILDDETASVLIYHGLNGVYLKEIQKWIRLDARGNKEGVSAQFSIETEQLAFSVRSEKGEEDCFVVFPRPDVKVLEKFRVYKTRTELWEDLPTELGYKTKE